MATQLLLEASIKQDERLLISRDLHDLLGHQLTALNLQLEVASHVEGARAAEHIHQAREISAQLMDNVRHAVTAIRNNIDWDIERAFHALSDNLPGIRIVLKVSLQSDISDIRLIEVLFRVTQEALTNVLRHANAETCWITVQQHSDNITLQVADDGRSHGAVRPGNGLNGIMERVESLHGQFEYHKDVNGFSIKVALPNPGA